MGERGMLDEAPSKDGEVATGPAEGRS
jgi:hypothetical protein